MNPLTGMLVRNFAKSGETIVRSFTKSRKCSLGISHFCEILRGKIREHFDFGCERFRGSDAEVHVVFMRDGMIPAGGPVCALVRATAAWPTVFSCGLAQRFFVP
jgi:hypothetical protein